MGQLTHKKLQELTGAYAIDAVDAEETEAMEAHLPGCERCRAEVAEHRETAALMGEVGGAAPDGIWARIQAGMAEESPPASTILNFARPESTLRRSRPFAAFAAAAVIAAVIGVGLSVKVADQDRQVRQLQAVMSSSALEQAARSAALQPGSKIVEIRSKDGAQWAQAVVLTNGEGYIVGDGLAPLGEGLTYQLWGVVGEQTISLGVLGHDPGIVPFTVGEGTTLLALTAEQAGGVAQSRNLPVATGAVPT